MAILLFGRNKTNYQFIDDEIPVKKSTINPKTRLVLTRFNENICSFVTFADNWEDVSCDSLVLEDNFPILGFNISPLQKWIMIINATRKCFRNITAFQGLLKSKKSVKFFS